MKKFNYILIAVLLVVGVLSSCDQRDIEPQQINILEQPFDGGGDDDDDPIIIGDTTSIN
jgi:hypothetical protein